MTDPKLTKTMRRVLEIMRTGIPLWRFVYDIISYDVHGKEVHGNTARALIKRKLVRRSFGVWKGVGTKEYRIAPAGRRALEEKK